MRHIIEKCIDAGTENCPCRLAASGDCLVCSRLAGHDYCDCKWQGVCIYNQIEAGLQRKARIYEIQKIKWYEKNLAVMRVAVPRGFAEKASLPGSFVFMKRPEAEPFFYTPISIMKSDYETGYVEMAMHISGPKTADLIGCTDIIQMKGIYRNGLLGVEKLEAPGPKKVLCMAKGAALAPLANYCRWNDGRDHIDFIIDTEKISKEFAEESLDGCRISSIKYGKLPLGMTWARQEDYDVIVLSASDHYQNKIYIPEAKRVVSNNSAMCCGEGVCGACIYTDSDGMIHRMCKCNRG